MNVTPTQILAEATEWMGTRWMHQQSVKGVACDCIGLVRGVAGVLGLLPPDFERMPEVAQYHGYSRQPDGRKLQAALDTYLERIAEPEPGAVLLMRFEQNPQHVAIMADGGDIIHAYATARKVVRHRLDDLWARRIVAVYRFPGVTVGGAA